MEWFWEAQNETVKKKTSNMEWFLEAQNETVLYYHLHNMEWF